MNRGSLLHVGCGGDSIPSWMDGFKEVRLDIDEQHKPDIVASMVDLGDIGEYDAIYCSHCLEHVCEHDVRKALSEFKRVLKPGGFAMVFVPDLENVKANDDVLYESPAGPITGLDLMYGHRAQLEDNPYMAHKHGFVKETGHRPEPAPAATRSRSIHAFSSKHWSAGCKKP